MLTMVGVHQEQIAKDIMAEIYPNQGLSKVDERLHCQPYDEFIHHKKTNVRRHIGMLSVYVQ